MQASVVPGACVDICAHQLGIAPDEMRLRNYIRPEEFPYTTPNGCVYDSATIQDDAGGEERIGWEDWKKKQPQRERKDPGWGSESHHAGFRHEQFWSVANVNPNAPFSGNSQAQTASWISMARLSLLSALVRKARVTKPPQRKLSPMSSTSTRTSLPCAQDSTRTKRSYWGFGHVCESICGLGSVRRTRRGAETEDRDEASGSFPP